MTLVYYLYSGASITLLVLITTIVGQPNVVLVYR